MNQIIKNKIYSVRNKQVMLDRDLAEFYQVKTIRLREQVKRNKERFPNKFMFQLTKEEANIMVSQNAIPSIQHLGGNLPYVFTEQGVAMLSGILRSKKAIEISIQIINAFASMRTFLTKNLDIFQRLNIVETKLLNHDNNFNQIFQQLETKKSEKGIFYDGQLFDTYYFISNLIKKAKKEIILIDNYVDYNTLNLFTKRNKNIKTTIYTKNLNTKLKYELNKFNSQYDPILIKEFTKSHDRFLIIDDEIYHIGASLKDLGKKWFAFSKLNIDILELLKKLK